MIPLPDSVKLKNRENIRYLPSKLLEPEAYQRYSKICNYAGLGIRIATDNEIDSLLDQLISNLSKQKAANTHLSCSGGDEKGSGGYSHIRTGLTIDRGKDNRAMLSKLNTPLLILLGESDQISWGCIADYLKVFRNVKLVIIPDSGHSVFTCQPDLCLKLTSEFLSSNSER
jgi:pimeloyl-ACP methyl ester carboxylesterase